MSTKQCACGALMERRGAYVICAEHCDTGCETHKCARCDKYKAGTARKQSQR